MTFNMAAMSESFLIFDIKFVSFVLIQSILSIVQFILCFWSIEIIEDILRSRKLMIHV